MKELLAGIVLIILLGVGGFLYRNEVTRPMSSAALLAPIQLATTTPSVATSTPASSDVASTSSSTASIGK